MLSAEARIATSRSSRYLAQLCSHLRHMGEQPSPGGGHGGRGDAGGHDASPPVVLHVECSGEHGVVVLDWGRCTLRATAEELVLRAEADDASALRRIQDGMTHRIEAIGRRDGLTVHWRPVAADPAPAGDG